MTVRRNRRLGFIVIVLATLCVSSFLSSLLQTRKSVVTTALHNNNSSSEKKNRPPPPPPPPAACHPVSDTALAYVAINLFPRPQYSSSNHNLSPTFSWSLHTLAAHGQFCGPVVIVTDQPRRVRALLSQVQQFHDKDDDAMSSMRFHVVPVDPAAPSWKLMLWGRQRHHHLYAKRFKTRLFDLLPATVNRSVEHILYLDSDVLVVQPVRVTLDRARAALGGSSNSGSNNNNQTDAADDCNNNPRRRPPAALAMLPENARRAGVRAKWEPYHSGVAFFTRDAQPCLQDWGAAIDSGQFQRDQVAFAALARCRDAVRPIVPDATVYFPDLVNPQLPPGATLVHYTATFRGRHYLRRDRHAAHRHFLEHEVGGIPAFCLDRSALTSFTGALWRWWFPEQRRFCI